jgi:hypothetical protein
MAKASFHTGWSGSPKHTSTVGDGSQLGGRGPAGEGPRIGPGCEGRNVRPEISGGGKNGRPAVRGMKRYSEE